MSSSDSDYTDAQLIELADAYRSAIVKALRDADWHTAHGMAKGWISRGGARTVEPWLAYSACSLQYGQRRPAVRAMDLALKCWVRDQSSRAVLLYVRGEIVRRHLADPKTAQADLDAAVDIAPGWLHAAVQHAQSQCLDEAPRSRKRKPSVSPAPAFKGPAFDAVRTPVLPWSIESEPPPIWPDVSAIVHSENPQVGTLQELAARS